MISIQCSQCSTAYSRQRVPKVLPCGHSMCSKCVFDILQLKGYYHCRVCAQKFDPNVLPLSPPTNILYFQILQKAEQIIKQKQWEQNGRKQNQNIPNTVSQLMLKIEEQCLYTFCQRRKFQRDGAFQLYCSQECKRNHEQLQQIF